MPLMKTQWTSSTQSPWRVSGLLIAHLLAMCCLNSRILWPVQGTCLDSTAGFLKAGEASVAPTPHTSSPDTFPKSLGWTGSCFTFRLNGGQFCISNQYWDIREILTNISAECPNWQASEGLPRSNSFVCLPQGAIQMCYFFLHVPRTRKSWETLSLVHIQSTSLELWLSSWDSLSRIYSTTFLKQMVSASLTSWLNIVHSPCSLNTHRGKNPRANIFYCTTLCRLLRYGILQQPPEGTIIIILILKITNFPKVIQVISGELGFESRRPDLRALGFSKC